MRLRSLALLLLVACLGCEPSIPPQPAPMPVDAHQSLVNDVKNIAVAWSSGNASNTGVRAYIANELQKLGLEVQRQTFSSGVNIIGIQKGQSAGTLIIGSQYDSVSGTPGADDNASGSAMTLLMARKLSQRKLKHTIRYVFFDDGEKGAIGFDYGRNMQERCDYMVNFGTVGNLRTSASLNYDEMVKINQYVMDAICNFDNHVDEAMIDSPPVRRHQP